MERVEILDRDAVRQIASWDSLAGQGEQAYDDILYYLETKSMTQYLKDYIEERQDKLVSDVDKMYGIDKRCAYVLKGDDGRVLAFTFFYLSDALNDGEYDMFIQSVAVNPYARGRGYGYKLLSTIMVNDDSYIGENVRRISAAVDFRNLSSQKLFGRLGIRKKSHIKNYYFMGGNFDNVKEGLLLQGSGEM